MTHDASRPTLRWGHININVADLDASMAFYGRLGFEVMMPGIPYLGLAMDARSVLPDEMADVLGVPAGTRARACIMQLGNTFPKIDLIEIAGGRKPLDNCDHGLVRICLGSAKLQSDVDGLRAAGVEFLSTRIGEAEALADVAICRDPDGTLVELIQPHLERWPGR